MKKKRKGTFFSTKGKMGIGSFFWRNEGSGEIEMKENTLRTIKTLSISKRRAHFARRFSFCTP